MSELNYNFVLNWRIAALHEITTYYLDTYIIILYYILHTYICIVHIYSRQCIIKMVMNVLQDKT